MSEFRPTIRQKNYQSIVVIGAKSNTEVSAIFPFWCSHDDHASQTMGAFDPQESFT
jgi:hypothetical protein